MSQTCESVRWKGPDAVRLANEIVELISLTGGGHLAAFRFLDHDGRPFRTYSGRPPGLHVPRIEAGPRKCLDSMVSLTQAGSWLVLQGKHSASITLESHQ